MPLLRVPLPGRGLEEGQGTVTCPGRQGLNACYVSKQDPIFGSDEESDDGSKMVAEG